MPLDQDVDILPAGLRNAGDPVDGNPFSPDNPRHAVWAKATLEAEEELCRLNAKVIREQPTRQMHCPEGAALMTPDEFEKWMRHALFEFENWMLALCAAKFDIWAKRAIHTVWNEADLAAYDQWLFSYAEAWLTEQKNAGRQEILPVLRSRLIERLESWKAEARRYLREQKKHAEIVRAQNSDKPAQSADTAHGQSSEEPESASGFTHTTDYRSVVLRGKPHSLTERQAHVIQILHEAHTNGTPEMGTALVLERLETPNSRLRDTFKTNLSAWKALVVRGQRKGTVRLNL